MMTTPVIEAIDLVKYFPSMGVYRSGRVPESGRFRQPHDSSGRDLRPGGRVRMWEDNGRLPDPEPPEVR
jgi:hypothetical protein